VSAFLKIELFLHDFLTDLNTTTHLSHTPRAPSAAASAVVSPASSASSSSVSSGVVDVSAQSGFHMSSLNPADAITRLRHCIDVLFFFERACTSNAGTLFFFSFFLCVTFRGTQIGCELHGACSEKAAWIVKVVSSRSVLR
jgi:hypothetical protein